MAEALPLAAPWLTSDMIDALGAELHDPEPIRRRRQAALLAFQELPIEPNPIFRGYANVQGSDLSELDVRARGPALPLPPAAAATLRLTHDASGTRVDLPELLTRAGVRVRTWPEVWSDAGDGTNPLAPVVPADKLTSLADALVNRAYRIEVPDGCPVPVRVQDLTLFSRPREVLSVRREIRAGTRSRLLFSEEVFSATEGPEDGTRLYGSTLELSVGAEAAVHHVTVHAPDLRALSLYQRHGRVGDRGRLVSLFAGLGGHRTRLKSVTELTGQASSTDDLQSFYGRLDQAYDSSIQITHIGTDTHAQSVTRGLYTDSAQGVSRGLVRIEAGARKTLSYLSEHAMLLSRKARSDTIPILEILCRDVKATHSSSVAPVDPEKVFYLASRGLSESDAVRMIGEGFLAHVLERAPIERLREALYPALAARWEGRPILWSAEHTPALPPLEVRDEDAPDDWRFDAKLR